MYFIGHVVVSVVDRPYFTTYLPIHGLPYLIHGWSFYTWSTILISRLTILITRSTRLRICINSSEIKDLLCDAIRHKFIWFATALFLTKKKIRRKTKTNYPLPCISFPWSLQKPLLSLASLKFSHHVLCFCMFTTGGNHDPTFADASSFSLIFSSHPVFLQIYMGK